MNEGPFELNSKPLLGIAASFKPAGLKVGASATGLNEGASGLNVGADTLRLDNPSMLGWPLLGTFSCPVGLTAGEKEKPEENDPGLKEAAGLNLNSLASILSFEIDECEVCLLCMADVGLPKLSLESLHELLTCDPVLECCAELFAEAGISPSSRLGFVTSEIFVLVPSKTLSRGFSVCCDP